MGDVSNPDITYGSAGFTADQKAAQIPPVPETGSGRNQPPDYQPVTITTEAGPGLSPAGALAKQIDRKDAPSVAKNIPAGVATIIAGNTGK